MIGRGTTVVENVVGGIVGFVLMCCTEPVYAYRRRKKRRAAEKATLEALLGETRDLEREIFDDD